MFSISVFIGDQSNTKQGELRNYETFEDLAKPFKKCSQGRKHSSYWVRGELDPMERKNKNLATSRLLVIDADKGTDGGNAPSPYLVHRKLKIKGINHFIYTSHSHTEDINKFRVVVPFNKPFTDTNLVPLMRGIVKDLGIGWVKEMGVMTQPWFTPTRDDVGDGQFKFYEYHDGEEYVQEIKAKSEAAEEKREEDEDSTSEVCRREEGDSESLDTLHENIRTGCEIHESLRTLTFQWVKDGMSDANAKAMARTVMNGSKAAGSERWQTRFDDIDRMVDGVFDLAEPSTKEFDLDVIAVDTHIGVLPRPPGMLGELEQACYDSLLYQYREVSIVSAIGLISGICGRRFNVVTTGRTGLNMYLTLIADTGVGKDGINKFISNSIMKCVGSGGDALKKFDSFIGPSSFTGGKAVFNAFKNARSRVCVSSESGLLLQSKAGDMAGKQVMILNMYNDSGADSYTRETVFSDEEKSIGRLRAVAATIISESTPKVLMEAYSSSGLLENGYIPRQMIFRVMRRGRMNRRVREYLPDNVRHKLHDLLETCSLVQSEEDPKAYDIEFGDDIITDLFKYIDDYDQLSEENAGINPIKNTMATRINLKVVRLAAIATVFNKTKGGEKCLVIEKPEWEWAKAICNYEFDNITGALGGLQKDQAMENAIVSVYKKMSNIIDDSIKSQRCKLDKRYRKMKVIPHSKLKIACSTSPDVKEISDKYGKMTLGLDKVLSHMKENNVIVSLKTDPIGNHPNVIQILPGMVDYMRGFGI